MAGPGMRRTGIALAALAGALFAAGLARDRLDAWVAATELPALVPEVSVTVLDRQDRLLRAYTVADGRWRLPVSGLQGVDVRFLEALVAYEDKRFRQHAGVDPRAMLRAGIQAAASGRVVSGGSTLSMQVARLLEESGTGRWEGKLRQLRVALALERRLDKDAILTLYLHHAPYGGNVEGIRAASLTWFGKEPRRLTPAEVALLVALPQSPEARRPDRDKAAARAARDRVLARMERAGLVDAEEARAARSEPVPTVRRPFPALAPHLSDRLRATDPAVRVHHTTLDANLQALLEARASEAAARLGARMSAAVVVADHRSGEIRATVGSAGYTDTARAGFVDMTRALRSPGSALKPLVYGLAFSEGLAHPETLIEDRPQDFGGWAPQNFDRRFRGTVRVRVALQESLNLPVVALADALGPGRVMERMARAGMDARLPGGAAAGLAVVLGGVGVTLEDMVRLYAALANGGSAVRLDAARMAPAPAGPQVLTPEAAWHVADILAGTPPPPEAPAGRIAWKTGTSYGHRDAWALGFDGAHVAGVWIGRADGTPVPGVMARDLAAPLLFAAFDALGAPVALRPPPPSTLLAGAGELPQPLRHFRAPGAAFEEASDGPRIAFPPDGARLAPLAEAGGLVVRVQDGTPPFTWLADGAPVLSASTERNTALPVAGPGFVHLTVIDAEGRSARASIDLR